MSYISKEATQYLEDDALFDSWTLRRTLRTLRRTGILEHFVEVSLRLSTKIYIYIYILKTTLLLSLQKYVAALLAEFVADLLVDTYFGCSTCRNVVGGRN